MIENDYQIVLDSVGQPYLEAEQRLVEQGESAIPFLKQKANEVSHFDKLVTQVIIEWISDDQTFRACLDYFERAEQMVAPTPVAVPPPEGVANYLVQHFGDRVASLLGVYMVKLEHLWPWKTRSAILYLGKLNGESSADALIRLISTTVDDTHRRLAVRSLIEVGDSNVLKKIETALAPLEAASSALQQARIQIQDKLEEKEQ